VPPRWSRSCSARPWLSPTGEVVRWIGAEDSDNPAAIVTVTAASEDEHPAPAATPAAPAATTEDSNNGLAIVALIVGALGVIVGAAGLLAARRASGRSGAAA
jgi:transcriptional regulator GlxA family with amidase domain